MKFLTIILCFLMVKFLYRLYEALKASYAVREFFKLLEEAEILYECCILVESGKIDSENLKKSFQTKITTEDMKYALEVVERAISYYEQNALQDFEQRVIDEAYEELLKMGVDLRRWLWVNKNQG